MILKVLINKSSNLNENKTLIYKYFLYRRQAIVITDGKSRLTDETKNEAHLCRDDGIVLTSVGIKSADYQELFDIAGDASRVYNVSDFDKLAEIVTGIEKTTCTGRGV